METGESKKVSFGVRTIAFTREKGFLLNGTPVKLQGGCMHHDNGIVGSRAYAAMEERKVRLLKESGFNAIRTSHNPMSTALLDACDRLGMLVMDEAFDQWRAKKNFGDHHLYFEDHWQEDLGSMVMRDRDHPSVIMYSIGNEIGERDGSGNGARISHDLCEYVRKLDPTRAITNGVCAVFLDAGEFGGILANIFGSGEAVDLDGLPDEVKEFLHQTDYVTEHWGEITADFVKDLDVVGYSDADEVEIVINGNPVKRESVPESHIVQTTVLYEPGTIEVANYTDGVKGEVSVLETTGEAVELKSTIENTEDTEGRRVPYCEWKVVCQTDENTELIGFGTGNPISEENYTSDHCILYEGRALLVLRKKNREQEIGFTLERI